MKFPTMTLQIPIIDMSKLIDGNEYELAALHTACKNWGFFQLINHGVEEEVIEKMKMDVKEFFKLPLEEKKICAQVPNNIEGYGQAFVVSQEQKLDWGDMLFLLPQPLSQRNMRFCPTNPTSFRATLDEYSLELQRISICLVRFIGRNLGIDPEKLASKFKDGTQGIRMNYYPHCAEAHKVIGLNTHSDASGLTLLIQANQVHGLQIHKKGKWIPIKPIPDNEQWTI